MKSAIPFKREKGQEELPPDQKQFNKNLAKSRVVVEHTISRVKKFSIFGQEFRNRLKRYVSMTDIVCRLVNFRIMGRKGLML